MRSAILFYTFTEAKTILLKAAVEDKSSPPLSFRDLMGNLAHPMAHGCSFLKLLFQPSRGCSAALVHWQWRALPGTIPPEHLAGLGHHLCSPGESWPCQSCPGALQSTPQGVAEGNFPCRLLRAQGQVKTVRMSEGSKSGPQQRLLRDECEG